MGRKSASTPLDLTEAQLEIMNLVWDRDELTVAEVWKELSQLRKVSRNTIQTLMTRLDARGWLAHRVEGKTFIYRAVFQREATQKQLLTKLLNAAFAGSASGLVMALLDGDLAPGEADRIRDMLDRKSKGEGS